MMTAKKPFTMVVIIIGLHLSPARAGEVNWVTDWQIIKADSLATGTTRQNDIQIDVSYTGHIHHISDASYFSERDPAPYTGNDVVDNRPTSGITLSSVRVADSGYANVLHFSSPVRDPLLALYSVGSPASGVPYVFDQPFTLLSEGWGGWGDGYFVIDTVSHTITGFEGNGVIQFQGMISSIAFNLPVAEYHHGFAVGILDSVVTRVGVPQGTLPAQFVLEQNYPNPFNPSTTIRFQIPESRFVQLKIFNILGKEAATLISASLPAGSYTYRWEAADKLSGGVYYYRLITGDFTETRKMLLIR